MSVHAGWARSRVLVASAVGYQWFYNGANFVAFKVGGDAIPPIVLAAMRFGLAAALILPLALWRWRLRPAHASELASAAGLGLVMLLGSQTLALMGTHLLPAGVASVFGSSAPIFLALFSWAILRKPLGRREVCGIALGFTGLALMAYFTYTGGGFHPLGAALTLAASASWAAGSLWARRLRLPADPVVALATQLVTTALVLAIAGGTTGMFSRIDMSEVPASAWSALAFLVIASTLVGYTVFLAVNAQVSPTIANTFNYAAPVVALLLSALLLDERLTLPKLLSAGVALAGVTLMVRVSRKEE
ncbi:EamA family transporter [Luteibacter sp. ME-Dv--P-043b]|uniref:DMT family transporter n=1 Tax=Luteibacter sp. ME-Dv--P-043b TaxID=3040291 RepID=UPI002555A7C5|nr:EamA family transporter [Luteibacter sp. ME-Dv--P-043b]